MTYSLRTLFFALGFCGFACFALINANQFWFSVCLTLVLLGLVACAVEALANVGQKRALSLGRLLAALVYLILIFCPWSANNLRPYLLTTQMVNFFDQHDESIALTYMSPGPSGSLVTQTNAGTSFFLAQISFVEAIAHCLFAFLAAVIGGQLGLYIDRQRRARQAAPGHTDQPREAGERN